MSSGPMRPVTVSVMAPRKFSKNMDHPAEVLLTSTDAMIPSRFH
jgi:hypothetical protein